MPFTHPVGVLVAWFTMLVVSVANGAARDFIYGKRMSELAAHQLSTFFGILLLGAVIWVHLRLCPPGSAHEAAVIGVAWLALTVAFEFLFFHFVGGHSWAALLANYNVFRGRVWVFIPIWLLVAPWFFYQWMSRQ
jgi:hypothetical protein